MRHGQPHLALGRVLVEYFIDHAVAGAGRDNRDVVGREEIRPQNFLLVQRVSLPEHADILLGRQGSRFDSASATLALTAVSLSEPPRELETLKALQEARYVQGLDTCDVSVVEALLRDLGLAVAADRLAASDAELLDANAARIRQAQGQMQTFGAQGVPALVVSDENGSRLLSGNALYGRFDSLLGQIVVAA